MSDIYASLMSSGGPRATLEGLPAETLLSIFSFVSLPDRCTLRGLSRRVAFVASTSFIDAARSLLVKEKDGAGCCRVVSYSIRESSSTGTLAFSASSTGHLLRRVGNVDSIIVSEVATTLWQDSPIDFAGFLGALKLGKKEIQQSHLEHNRMLLNFKNNYEDEEFDDWEDARVGQALNNLSETGLSTADQQLDVIIVLSLNSEELATSALSWPKSAESRITKKSKSILLFQSETLSNSLRDDRRNPLFRNHIAIPLSVPVVSLDRLVDDLHHLHRFFLL